MSIITSHEREMKRLQLEELRQKVKLSQLDIEKRAVDILLVKQQIMSAKNTRMIMRVTAILTSISIITTILNYFGVFAKL